jgi:hypothetical protein
MPKLDTYSFYARLVPVILVILPAATAVAAWIPAASLPKASMWMTPITVVIAFFLAQLGRDAGKRAEPKLWNSWGGAPTTRRLRHSAPDVNPVIRERQHRKLSELLRITFPSAEEEAENPSQADSVYETAIQFLRERTRNSPLVFKENVSYGFRRNLWAMKPAGTVLSIAGTAIAAGVAIVRYVGGDENWAVSAVLGIVNACFTAWWLVRINPNWVRLAAEAYAERLLASCEALTGIQPAE